MSFGSNFIHQSRYYDPLPKRYDVNRVYLDVVRATADSSGSGRQAFPGRAAREWVFEHAAVACQLADARPGDCAEPSSLRRTQSISANQAQRHAPEWAGLAGQKQLRAELRSQFSRILRQCVANGNDRARHGADHDGHLPGGHGRFARPDNPCWCWITEVNYAPGEDGVTRPGRLRFASRRRRSRATFVFT